MRSEQPILFCFCGPTASGKSTLCKRLVEQDAELFLSVSTTTRKPRAAEKDGVDYFFVSTEEFEQRVTAGSFVEHAIYSGNAYGTEKQNIKQASAAGRDLLLDIEVEGVRQLKQEYKEQVVTVFVFPPSFAVLEQRLRARGSETEQVVTKRLTRARQELEILADPKFSDYLVINDRLDQALTLARTIIFAERLRLARLNPSILVKMIGTV